MTRKEVRQLEDYEIELRSSGKITSSTLVTGFVLAASLGEDARESIRKGDFGNTVIYPRTYGTVLRQAHARTFNLAQKLRLHAREDLVDSDVEAVLRGTTDQLPLEVPAQGR